jgi:hypothetical protein
MAGLYGDVVFESSGRAKVLCVPGTVFDLARLGGCAKEPWRVFGSYKVGPCDPC